MIYSSERIIQKSCFFNCQSIFIFYVSIPPRKQSPRLRQLINSRFRHPIQNSCESFLADGIAAGRCALILLTLIKLIIFILTFVPKSLKAKRTFQLFGYAAWTATHVTINTFETTNLIGNKIIQFPNSNLFPILHKIPFPQI